MQRQRREGGSLDTCLLELGHLGVDELCGYLGRVTGIEVLSDPDPETYDPLLGRSVDDATVQATGILPIRREGSRIQALVAREVNREAVQATEARLGAHLSLQIVPEFRWEQARALMAGKALEPRFAALVERQAISGATTTAEIPTGPVRADDAKMEVHGGQGSVDSGAKLVVDDGVFGSRNWSLDELSAYFERSKSRDDLLRATVGFVGNVLERRMVIVPSERGLAVFDAAGFGPGNEGMTEVRGQAEAGSMLDRVIRESAYFFGSCSSSGAEGIYLAAGVEAPAEVALVPVRVGRKVALIIAGDNGLHAVDPRLIPLLFVVAGRLGAALEAMIRRRKKAKSDAVHAQVAPSEAPEARAAAQAANARVLERLRRASAEVLAPSGTLPDEGWELPDTSTTIPRMESSVGVGAATRPSVALPTRPSMPVTAETQPLAAAVAPPVDGLWSVETGSTLPAPRSTVSDSNRTQILSETVEAARREAGQSPMTTESGLLVLDLEPVGQEAPHPTLSVAAGGADSGAVADSTHTRATTGSREDSLASAGIDELIARLSSTVEGVAAGAQAELLARGASAHTALMAVFPGPIFSPQPGSTLLDTPVETQGRLLQLVLLQADALAPSLEGLVHSGNPTQRFYALSILWRAQAPSAVTLAVNHVLDGDEALRMLCVRIIDQSRDPAARAATERRAITALGAADPAMVERSISLCHSLRLAAPVPRMIELLDAQNGGIASRAHTTLVRITLRDPGTTSRRWLAWLQKQPALDRNRWLLEAMVDPDRKVRENAQRELRLMPGILVNYTPDLDAHALQAAQRAVAQRLGVRQS